MCQTFHDLSSGLSLWFPLISCCSDSKPLVIHRFHSVSHLDAFTPVVSVWNVLPPFASLTPIHPSSSSSGTSFSSTVCFILLSKLGEVCLSWALMAPCTYLHHHTDHIIVTVPVCVHLISRPWREVTISYSFLLL